MMMRMRHALLCAAVFNLGVLPALLGRDLVARVSALYPLALGGHPYFLWAHPLLLYALLPLVVCSSFLLIVAPGAVFVLIRSGARNFSEWLVLSFGASLLFMIALGTMIKLLTGGSLHATLFLAIWVAALDGMLLWLIVKMRNGAEIRWPFQEKTDRRRLIWTIASIYTGVTFLLPKIFWEDFNLDGIEAFEFGRSLSNHILPHWEIFDSVFGFYGNFFLFSYPNHWFITLFGPFEASVRIPYFLYLVVAFSALLLLIEWKKSETLNRREEAALWLALVVFTIVQAFSTNYEPFFADLGETAATDLLQVICFLSACYALFEKRNGWFWIFGLMTFASGPGGLLLLAALPVALVFSQLQDRRSQIKEAVLVLGVCMLVTLLYEVFYIKGFLGGVNDQFSMKNMIRRLYPPTITEFTRWNALLLPCGLLPALSLVAVRKRNQIEWIVAVITAIYFAVLYVQAWSALHQFTVAMILPLIVFWRLYLNANQVTRRWIYPAVLIFTFICLILSLPRHFQINQSAREFGMFTSYTVGEYEESYESALRGAKSLYALLPKDYRLHYPNQPWGIDHHVWIYYATRKKPATGTLNYLVRPVSASPPEGVTLVRSADGVAVYVRDLKLWRRHREQKFPQVPASPVYEPILAHTYQFFRDFIERSKQAGSKITE